MRALGAEPMALGLQASLAGALSRVLQTTDAPVQPEATAVGPTLLQCLLEIAALGVLTVVALQTTWFFADRWIFFKRVSMYLTAFGASFLALSYSWYKLGYWLAGIGGFYTCTSAAVVAPLLQNMANLLAFGHLFQRADAINAVNPRWHRIRPLAILLQLGNAVALIMLCFDRTTTQVDGPDGARCRFLPDKEVLRAKYILQLINHVGQSAFFVWPLAVHIRRMDRSRNGGLGTSYPQGQLTDVYHALIKRAIIASVGSVLVTLVMTILVFFFQASGTPTAALNIVDLTATLVSIYFATGTMEATGTVAASGRLPKGSSRQDVSASGAPASDGDVSVDGGDHCENGGGGGGEDGGSAYHGSAAASAVGTSSLSTTPQHTSRRCSTAALARGSLCDSACSVDDSGGGGGVPAAVGAAVGLRMDAQVVITITDAVLGDGSGGTAECTCASERASRNCSLASGGNAPTDTV